MPPHTRQQLSHRRSRRRAAQQRRNRRIAASVGVPALISGLAMLVLWIGIGRSSDGATTTAANPVPALGPGARPPDIPIAAAGQVQLRLPVDPDRVTAVMFHPVDDPRALDLRPIGPLPWHEVPRDERRGAARGGVDVGARQGTMTYSPVDGTVLAVVPFVVRGRQKGSQFVIKPSNALGVAVLVTHVEPILGQNPPRVGATVQAGRTPLGQVSDLSDVVTQEISQFTADDGNHVAISVARLDNP